MQYVARIKREGRHWLAEFPDASGCYTFAESKAELAKNAAEALESWLLAEMIMGQVPPVPRARLTASSFLVQVPIRLAVAVQIRQARALAGLSQAELAKRLGVTQQQIAKLESPKANPSLDTLEKLATALGTTVDVAFAATPAERKLTNWAAHRPVEDLRPGTHAAELVSCWVAWAVT